MVCFSMDADRSIWMWKGAPFVFMKKMILLAGPLFIFAFVLTACGLQNTQNVILNELGMDVSNGNEISNLDTHGGFHGDGMTCIVLSFPDHKVLEQIKADTRWKAFPLDGTAKTLIYGISDETSIIGPFLNDGNGDPLVPEIQNGYYLLIDRHTGKGTDILNRGSFNFTLVLYDTDADTLYYCKLDT